MQPGIHVSVPAALACALAMTFAVPANAADIQLAPALKHQVMTGWEMVAGGWATTSTGMYDPTWKAIEPLVLDRAANELGVNRVRVEIPSGIENPVDYWSLFTAGQIDYSAMRTHFYEKINDNLDPFVAVPAGFKFARLDASIENEVLPLKRRVEANGEKLWVSLCYVDFQSTPQGSFSHALAPDEYAELIVTTFEHLDAKYGLTPDSLELVLEPDNTRDWRGAQLGRGAVAVKTRLRAAGYDPELIAPSTAAPSAALTYLAELSTIPGATSVVTTLSYHRYGLADPSAIRAAAQARGMRTAMLEHTSADVNELYEDLTVGDVSAWQKYALSQPSAANDYAYYVVDRSSPASPVISLAPRAALLLPYFKYVRSGAQRIEVRSNDASVRAAAFINSNGSYVVVVMADDATPVRVTGLPAGTYGAATVRYDGPPQVESGPSIFVTAEGVLGAQVPSGVTALYGRAAPAAPAVPALPSGAIAILLLGLVGLGAQQHRASSRA